MNRLKELRQAKGDRQEDLASLLGVSTMTISRWEKDEELSLKLEQAKKLADYFEVDIGQLLGHEDNFYKSVLKLSENDSDDQYFRAFRTYYELKVSDGQDNFLKLKDSESLEILRKSILRTLIPDIDNLDKEQVQLKISSSQILNEAEYKLNDFFFSLGTLGVLESQMLADFILFSDEDKTNILNIVKSLSKK